jgi:hypothetical protein
MRTGEQLAPIHQHHHDGLDFLAVLARITARNCEERRRARTTELRSQ